MIGEEVGNFCTFSSGVFFAYKCWLSFSYLFVRFSIYEFFNLQMSTKNAVLIDFVTLTLVNTE